MSDLNNKPVCYNCNKSLESEYEYMECSLHKEPVLKNNTCNSFEQKQGIPKPKIWIYNENDDRKNDTTTN